MTKKRTSKAGSSRSSVIVKDALGATSSKRKAKKWSKHKTRQKQKEVDDQVDAVHAAILPIPQISILLDSPKEEVATVNALEQSLRGL